MTTDTRTQALSLESVTRDLQGLVRALYAEADKCEMFNIDTPAKLLREAAAVIQPEANAQTMDMFAEVASAGHLAEELDNLRVSLHHLADEWDQFCELPGDGCAAKLREIAGDHKPHRKLPILPPDKAERVHAIVNAGHFPGMSEAFDAHMGAACWADPAYAPDASMWAAAWKAAKAQPDHFPDAGKMVAVPQGWKLVPLEPTDAMLDASCLMGEINSGSLRGAWRDMLAAAPAAPAPALVPLTRDQIAALDAGCGHASLHWDIRVSLARAVERAHGIGGKA